jgi:hypothetical protein
MLIVSPGSTAIRTAEQQEHRSGRCSTTSSGVVLMIRL